MGVMKELPAYARPIFVRLVKKRLDLTGEILVEAFRHLIYFFSIISGTYKLKKNLLQEEGFDVGNNFVMEME